MLKNKIILSIVTASCMFGSSINLNMANKNKIVSHNNVIQAVSKSIVNISTKQKFRNIDNTLKQIFDDPFIKQFFNYKFTKKALSSTLGSGVVISKDGYIITSAHIVNNNQKLTISFNKKIKVYDAKVIAINNNMDLAVLKIDAKDLTPIKLGYANNHLIGDEVYAIGNPYAISPLVTKGIISSTQYENFIQTDAKINPQNSGGALIDSSGSLIGINQSNSDGIGFATSVSMIKKMVEDIIKNGKVIKGYLGISTQNLDNNLKKAYNHNSGVLVLDVIQNSCAADYHIKRGDLIYKINNQKILNQKDFNQKIDKYNPNDKLTLQIERDKKDITINLTLGVKNISKKIATNQNIMNGLFVSNITKQNQQRFKIPKNAQGVLIHNVLAQSKAEKNGFLSGDIIVQIENIEISDVDDLQKALKTYKHKQKRVYINRYGKLFIVVE